MMVKVVIALVIVGIAAWLYFRNTSITTPVSTDTGTPDQRQSLGGISFVITPGTAATNAAAAGATAYDPNDPVAAQRRLDALNRAQVYAQDPNAYQAHVAQSLAAQQQETAAIMAGVS